MIPAAGPEGLLGARFARGFVLVDREDGRVTVGLGQGKDPGDRRPSVRILPFDPDDPRDPGPWAPPPPLVPRWVATRTRPGDPPRWCGDAPPREGPPGSPPPLPAPGRLELPPEEAVVRRVKEALAAVHAGGAEKIVPSCGARLVFPAPPAPGALVAGLLAAGGPPGASTRFAILSGGRLLLGATPERLFRLRPGGILEAEALAGTAGPGEGKRLLASPKDRAEHDLVVRDIRRALAPLAEELVVPRAPRVRSVPGLVHLHTPVTARLRPGVTPAGVLAALHPTPAVAGAPRERALEWLRAREPARGAFAAPLLVEHDDGTVEASVLLRTAVLQGNVLHLRAGAGIVAGSDPVREAREILAKLRATVASLGIRPAATGEVPA